MVSPSGEFAWWISHCSRRLYHTGLALTMYSQKSLLGNDMMAWKEYGPDP